MALIKARTWNPDGGEESVLRHLEKIFENEDHDVYLFHNVLLGTLKEDLKLMKPDFIILDPKRGIAVIEEKSWQEFTLHGNHVIFKNGEKDLNPIVKGQNYYFNLVNILKNRGVKLDQGYLKTHLVFTSFKHDDQLQGDFVTSHFSNFKETLCLENLFDDHKVIAQELLVEIHQVFDPVVTFCNDSKDFDKNISKLDKKQSEIVCKNPFGHYLVSGIPGSGKSIMVSSRALFLNEEFPDWKILILSVNRNLANKIQKDIEQRTLGRKDLLHTENIEIKTLISFLNSCCPSTNRNTLEGINGYSE